MLLAASLRRRGRVVQKVHNLCRHEGPDNMAQYVCSSETQNKYCQGFHRYDAEANHMLFNEE